MYEIKKNGKHLSYEDVIRYVKLQSNGIYCLCSDDEATGVVVNNDYICHLAGRAELPNVETVSFDEINGASALYNAQAELEEVLSAARSGLTPIPTQGATWDPETRYIAGDIVEGGYIAIRYSKGKNPADPANIGIYWEENVTPHLVWNDIEDGTIIAEDTIVVHDGKTWKCISQHIKSSVYKPRTGSSKWVEVT